jgi:hypothetical protein
VDSLSEQITVSIVPPAPAAENSLVPIGPLFKAETTNALRLQQRLNVMARAFY